MLHFFLLAPQAQSFSVTIVSPLLFISFLITSHYLVVSWSIRSHPTFRFPHLPTFCCCCCQYRTCVLRITIFLSFTRPNVEAETLQGLCLLTHAGHIQVWFVQIHFLARPSSNVSSPIARVSQSKQFHFHLYRVIKLSEWNTKQWTKYMPSAFLPQRSGWTWLAYPSEYPNWMVLPRKHFCMDYLDFVLNICWEIGTEKWKKKNIYIYIYICSPPRKQQ